MVPQTSQRPTKNSSKVNLLISAIFHAAIVLALAYFAAREGLLGKQLKKIAVEMVKEEPPPKPKEPEPEKPREEPLPVEKPAVAETPPVETPPPIAAPPPPANAVAAPPPVAPPAAEVPSFVFEGGKAVQSSSDPVALYKSQIEFALHSKWDRPTDMQDDNFIAEIEVSVDRSGRLGDHAWKRSSGDKRWDGSVRQALSATPSISRPPPTNFPPRIIVRFDVQAIAEPALQ
ncbi:MAG TPA: TonB C-terminal domain-containing protein [Verrucomicrobiota bacterium]|nr:hypothetical protein [Verrucomicrobiales bacterium]HRI11953.1 TonB C-terminal domain-containing protein [Verrucomicrobiota bacterium]